MPLRCVPAAALGRPVGEMPGEHERVLPFLTGGDVALEAERPDGVADRRFGAKLAVGGKIIPERHGAYAPAAASAPSAKRGDGIACADRREGETAGKRVRLGQKRVLHKDALQVAGGAELIRAALAAHRVVD